MGELYLSSRVLQIGNVDITYALLCFTIEKFEKRYLIREKSVLPEKFKRVTIILLTN